MSDLSLSRSLLRRLQPDAFRWGGLRRHAPSWERLSAHLASEPEPAMVVSLDPPRIAAYAGEIDTVVFLAFPEAAFARAGLTKGQRLTSLNTYRSVEEGFAPDLEPGERARGIQGQVTPLIAELCCEPSAAVDALRGKIESSSWERFLEVLEAFSHRRHLRVRDGRPLQADIPHEEVPAEEALQLPALRPRGRGRCLLVALLLIPLLAFALLYITARILLRHEPYLIPSELQAPTTRPAQANIGLGVRLRYLGISGYEISDGQTTIWVDPNPTRPTVNELISGPLEPDTSLYKAWKLRYADYILVGHAHHDHILDVPALAKKTGATVVGSRSAIQLCRSRGIPDEKLKIVEGGERLELGSFVVDVAAKVHGPIGPIENPMHGVIPNDAGPLWFWEYRQDGVRNYRLSGGGTSIYATAGSGAADPDPGWEASVLLLMFATGGYTDDEVRGVLARTKARIVIPTHCDNFFHPLSEGLALLPGLPDPMHLRGQFLAEDPDLKVFMLEYGQSVLLPPDPVR